MLNLSSLKLASDEGRRPHHLVRDVWSANATTDSSCFGGNVSLRSKTGAPRYCVVCLLQQVVY